MTFSSSNSSNNSSLVLSSSSSNNPLGSCPLARSSNVHSQELSFNCLFSSNNKLNSSNLQVDLSGLNFQQQSISSALIIRALSTAIPIPASIALNPSQSPKERIRTRPLMSTLRRAEQEQEATQPLKQQHSCLARCENQALQLLAPELSRHQNAALSDENKNQTVLSSCKSSQYQCKQKVYSLNIGHEKSSFYLKTELVEELKLYQSMEVSQKPTFVMQEMILKDKARRELSALNNNPSSSAHSNNKTRNQLEFDLLMSGTSEGALRISREENAGGNSVFSEALSFEVVKRMFSAELLKTEMEIEYYPGSKKTDYLVRIGQKKYGVSVTRAFNFNDFTGGNGVLTDKMLQLLLYKKLSGIIASSGNVYDEDVWEKQFLHCWVPSMDVAKRLKRQYAKMKCSVKSNTILLVTVASEARSIFMENSADHEQ